MALLYHWVGGGSAGVDAVLADSFFRAPLRRIPIEAASAFLFDYVEWLRPYATAPVLDSAVEAAEGALGYARTMQGKGQRRTFTEELAGLHPVQIIFGEWRWSKAYLSPRTFGPERWSGVAFDSQTLFKYHVTSPVLRRFVSHHALEGIVVGSKRAKTPAGVWKVWRKDYRDLTDGARISAEPMSIDARDASAERAIERASPEFAEELEVLISDWMLVAPGMIVEVWKEGERVA